MSATPIPRTLHMSLLGIRDMSVIETPPKDRLAIHTVVAHFDPELVRTAIEQELSRGGQVYFVHNRIDSIFTRAAWIQELVPQARIGVGHGQMGEAELERVLLGFMRHEYDVFVSHHHRRKRAGYSAGEHHDHRSCRAPRPLRAVPVARPRGTVESASVCVSAGSRRHRAVRDRTQTPGGAARVFRPGRGVQDRRARPGAARRRQPAGRRAARPHRRGRVRYLRAAAGRNRARAQGRRSAARSALRR